LSDQPTALVTGASSGIGEAIARRLAQNGIRVLVGYNTGHERAQILCETINSKRKNLALPIPIDLKKPYEIASCFGNIIAHHGPIQYLVNNAGINDRSPGMTLDPERLREVLAINLESPLLLSSAAGRYFMEQGLSGSIVNITSVHDRIPISGGALYCASKGGLAVASRALALEFAPHGIRVNLVAPGETATPMNGIVNKESYVPRPAIPCGRAGMPSEIANAVAWLLSSEATYTVGATLYIDGGLMLTAAEENAKSSTQHVYKQSGRTS
jgi:glucose 1-dehydrogenase